MLDDEILYWMKVCFRTNFHPTSFLLHPTIFMLNWFKGVFIQRRVTCDINRIFAHIFVRTEFA